MLHTFALKHEHRDADNESIEYWDCLETRDLDLHRHGSVWWLRYRGDELTAKPTPVEAYQTGMRQLRAEHARLSALFTTPSTSSPPSSHPPAYPRST